MYPGSEIDVKPDSLSPVITTALEQERARSQQKRALNEERARILERSIMAEYLERANLWDKKIRDTCKWFPESLALPTRSFVEAWTQRRPTRQPARDEVGLFGDTVSYYKWKPQTCHKSAFNELNYLRDIGR
jgi:hypothetical protein